MVAEQQITPDLTPEPAIWCSNCRTYMPARAEYWSKAILDGGSGGGGRRCRPCAQMYRAQYAERFKQNSRDWKARIRSLSLPELLDLKADYEAVERAVPGFVWERVSVEINKMRRNPSYAAEVFARAQVSGE